MDFESLKNQVTNLSVYDLKAGFRKAQNVVLNLTEMEAKVREATNNEPWGASTTMMQEIANATFNYAQLNEVMPMIYKRFTEKAAEEWRQIYKALQLLEFLIKNGSERVVDDARSHISLLKMLRQFHYIDPNGKDQGVNVRNRAKELADLLGDVDRIRAERKKSRSTRNKYRGHEGGAGLGPSTSSGGGRYGGFGSESAAGDRSFGGFSGGVYGDGGGFGGEPTSDDYNESSARRERFEEYDEYDDGGAQAPVSARRKAAEPASSKPAPPPKAKEPEVDLFSFGDDDITSTPAVAPSNATAATALQTSNGGDDDFDDFQSASPTTTAVPTSATTFAAPQPAPPSSNLNSILSSISPPPQSAGAAKPNYAAFSSAVSQPPATQFQAAPQMMQPMQQSRPAGPNYFGSIPVSTPTPSSTTGRPGPPSSTAQASAATTKKSSGGDPFASLAIGGGKKAAGSAKGPTIAELSKQKTSQGLWGTPNAGSGGGSGDLI